jgi:hypothetical protein
MARLLEHGEAELADHGGARTGDEPGELGARDAERVGALVERDLIEQDAAHDFEPQDFPWGHRPHSATLGPVTARGKLLWGCMTDQRVDGAHARVLLQALGMVADHIGESVTLDQMMLEIGASDRVVVHDQDDTLDVGLDALTAILRDYGHDVSYECEAERALVSCAGRSTTVESGDIGAIAAALSKLVFGRVAFRGTARSELIGLSSGEWRKLDRAIPALVKRVFPPVTGK